MVLTGNKYLTQGNSLAFCKANVSLDSKIQAVSRKNEPWLAAVRQAASHSLQQGAELFLVTVGAQGVKKCTLQLARGIYWVFCLSQCQCIPAQTRECLVSYVTKEVHYKVYKCHFCPITHEVASFMGSSSRELSSPGLFIQTVLPTLIICFYRFECCFFRLIALSLFFAGIVVA